MNQPVDDHRRNQIKHTNHVFDLYHMCNRLIIAVRANMELELRINKKLVFYRYRITGKNKNGFYSKNKYNNS